MTKIKDLQTGTTAIIPLVIHTQAKRTTKTKKTYLDLTLFDGEQEINAKIWSYPDDKSLMPTDTVYNIEASVGEWQGKKQLTIIHMKFNTELSLKDFLPSSGLDIDSIYTAAKNLAASITDPLLHKLTKTILEDLEDKWKTIPAARSIHHAFVGGTLLHCYSVARIADRIAQSVKIANRDLCVCGGLLHDVGKLFGYAFNGSTIDFTDDGQMFEHVFMGAEFVDNFADNHGFINTPEDEAKIALLKHIILSHHGSLEFGSPVPPMSIEATIVSAADHIDATTEMIVEAAKQPVNEMWTGKIYGMNNRPAILPDYTKNVMQPKNNS